MGIKWNTRRRHWNCIALIMGQHLDWVDYLPRGNICPGSVWMDGEGIWIGSPAVLVTENVLMISLERGCVDITSLKLNLGHSIADRRTSDSWLLTPMEDCPSRDREIKIRELHVIWEAAIVSLKVTLTLIVT